MLKGKISLDLDEAWRSCLKMWKEITERYEDGMDIYSLKEDYIKKHRISEDLEELCYFCEYTVQHKRKGNLCTYCPGCLVDKEFDCVNPNYHYAAKPHAFYRKLLALNKQRLSQKKPN